MFKDIMPNFSLSRAMGAIMRTLPFVLLRLIVYAGMALAVVFAVAVGGGIGYGIGRMAHGRSAAGHGALWGSMAGFALTVWLIRLAREYVLYLVKAGHIAILVELYDGHPIPRGEAQIRQGAHFVRTHFAESSVLFAVDQIVKAVLRGMIAMVNRFAFFVPVPGLRAVLRLAESAVRISLTFVDEIILAYMIRTRTQNPWDGAKDGIVLYAQNYGHFLKNALWLSFFLWAITIAIFAVFLVPAGVLAASMPGSHWVWSLIFAFAFARAIKAAILEPLAIAALMEVFFTRTDGQTPDPAWQDRLERASRKFRELVDRAGHWAPRPPPPQAPLPGVAA
jgi:hypothetical protein